MSAAPTAHRFVFVGGLQRSGTTLLTRLLTQHPDIAGLVNTPTREDEGQFIQSVYLDDHKMGAADKGRRGQVARWAYHREAHLTETDLAARPDAAGRLEESWAPFWDKPAAPVYLEKSPSNLTRTRFLQAAFPDAGFVVITRHPIVQALAVLKWTTRRARLMTDFDRIVDHWLTAMELYADDAARLTRTMTCRYEDLIRDPHAVLAEVQSFIGVAVAELDTSRVEDRETRYVNQWRSITGPRGIPYERPKHSPLPDRVPVWAERAIMRAFGKRSARVINARYDDRMRRFGYRALDLSA